MSIFGIGDIERELLLSADDQTLGRLCRTNQFYNRIWQNEGFWFLRLLRYFGSRAVSYKPPTESYRQQYQRLRQLNYNSYQAVESVFNGQIDELIVLSGNGVSLHNELTNGAARTGNRRLIEWLLDQGLTFTDYTVGQAARGGHLDLMNLLVEKGAPGASYALSAAMYSASPETLDWFLRRGIVPNHRFIRSAIAGGNIRALEWLLLRGIVPIDADVAAWTGQTEVLDWMEERLQLSPQGSEGISNIVARKGYVRTLQWLEDHHIMYPDSTAADFVSDVIKDLTNDPSLSIERRQDVEKIFPSRRYPSRVMNRLGAAPTSEDLTWEVIRPFYTQDDLETLLRDYIETLRWMEERGIYPTVPKQ